MQQYCKRFLIGFILKEVGFLAETPTFGYPCLFLLALFAKLLLQDILQRGLADLLKFLAKYSWFN